MSVYGMELIADFKNCDPKLFTRESLREYFEVVCDAIKMKRGPFYFWDYEGDDEKRAAAPEHLAGVTAVQFLYTSNITIHTLDKTRDVYLNLFSCSTFDPRPVISMTELLFCGYCYKSSTMQRGSKT